MNKQLKFENSNIVNCVDRIYRFIDLDDEDIAYGREQSAKFDDNQRGFGIEEEKKTNAFSFFQKEIIDKCVQGPILSVGCGTMYFDKRISTDLLLVPLDKSRFMLEYAVRRGRTKFAIEADATSLPFGDNQFELTYCIDGLPGELHSGPESRFIREKLLNEMLRVTVKGRGRIVLLLPNRNKTKFLNIIKFKQFKRVQKGEYGFSPGRLYDELIGMGFEIDHYSYKMCICPFRI